MTQPTDRETALIMFRSTLALHGTPSPEAARIAIMFAARMAVEAGITAGEYRRLTVDEYANTVSDHEAREAKLRDLGFDAVDPDTLGTLARLRSNSARPETRTFVTNHLIVAPDSGPTKASSGYNPPLDGPVLYTRQQVEAMLRTALTDRTPEWTSRTVDERVEILLAIFTLPMKENP